VEGGPVEELYLRIALLLSILEQVVPP